MDDFSESSNAKRQRVKHTRDDENVDSECKESVKSPKIPGSETLPSSEEKSHFLTSDGDTPAPDRSSTRGISGDELKIVVFCDDGSKVAISKKEEGKLQELVAQPETPHGIVVMNPSAMDFVWYRPKDSDGRRKIRYKAMATGYLDFVSENDDFVISIYFLETVENGKATFFYLKDVSVVNLYNYNNSQ